MRDDLGRAEAEAARRVRIDAKDDPAVIAVRNRRVLTPCQQPISARRVFPAA